MQRRTAGFTGIEILIVLVIGGVLMALAMPSLSRALSRRGALNARDAFVFLAARARSSAIELGRTVELRVDPAADRAWLFDPVDGDTLAMVDYSGEFEADVALARNGAGLGVCFNPRGLGGPCGTMSLPDTVRFTRGAQTAGAEVRALGQVLKL